jgi:hypothetical protein
VEKLKINGIDHLHSMCNMELPGPAELKKRYETEEEEKGNVRKVLTDRETGMKETSLYSGISIYHFSREWRKQTMNMGKRLIRKTTFFYKKVVHCPLLFGRILLQLKI